MAGCFRQSQRRPAGCDGRESGDDQGGRGRRSRQRPTFPRRREDAEDPLEHQKIEGFPTATVPGTQHDVDFMLKDSKRFADSGGWGYVVFEYDAASDTFRPGNSADKPPQANDANSGFACHTTVKAKDYVLAEYGKR